MKKILLIGVLVLVGVSVAYCQHFWFPYTWHQKMTVEVELNDQVYSGSSVVQVRWHKNDPIGAVNGPAWLSGIRGEATVVEIPGRGLLFGLLNSPADSTYTANLATQVVTWRKGWPRGQEEFSRVKETRGQPLTVPPDRYPFMVTFTDIADPKSVQKIDPHNLAATFGPGVSLKRITLEITDEPVTEGKIEHVLGWLDDPTVMKNPGWKSLPYDARVAINGLFKGKLIVSEK